ncbi:MAG: YqaA family protein [Gemmatimonadaceae bacterium]
MTAQPGVERRGRKGLLSRWLLRLIAVLHRWGESGWAGPAAATWGVLQGSVVPGPSDTLLVPLGLADPKRVWRLVAWAIVGSTIGGTIAWAIGALAYEDIAEPLLSLLGFDLDDLARTERLFSEKGWLLVAFSAFTPISTKLVCIAAGTFGMPLQEFVPALAVGRALRFLTMAIIVRFAGERLVGWAERKLGRPIESAT